MLLDRIDIDVHGPLAHVELGPFSEHLNVVFGPQRSGKTAISRFVRDSIAHRDYPLGMFSSSVGRVVWADRNGLLHCRREQDGTPQGRCTIEYESRGNLIDQPGAPEDSWMDGISPAATSAMAIRSVQIPESIVDGVITDTSLTSLARVVSSCVRSGLDAQEAHHRLPLEPSSIYYDRDSSAAWTDDRFRRDRHLRDELAEIDAELARHSDDQSDLNSLAARRNRLTAKLADIDRSRRFDHTRPEALGKMVDRAAWQRRVAVLHERARQLRARQSELRRWISEIDADLAHSQAYPSASAFSRTRRDEHEDRSGPPRHERHSLVDQRRASIAQLDRVTAELDSSLREAGRLRRSMHSHPTSEPNCRADDGSLDWIDRDAVIAEIRRIDDRMAGGSRYHWLRTRRSELLHRLGGAKQVETSHSPLAESSSRWLSRLSSGRLRRISWTYNRFRSDGRSYHRDLSDRTGVTIDGRDESECTAPDRALAVIAVRMAAGEFLAQTGRPVPLVLETHQNLRHHADDFVSAYSHHGQYFRGNDSLATALHDYAAVGRQVIVLTNDHELSNHLSRVGAREFQLHAARAVHPHRPLWRPHFEAESYVGPHPHTYADRDALDMVVGTTPRCTAPVTDINRNFDEAWHESRAARPNHFVAADPSRRTDWARDGIVHRDGYFYADHYTTALGPTPVASANTVTPPSNRLTSAPPQRDATPFFLTVDSPVDQAPSIDAVASARLRGLNVTHITHLMNHDPNRLADALGLADVDAATVRRWQAECRLVCRVPRLRGFDARVLVGCGVTTPAQLASIHPIDLLDEVESFLATPEGQQILLSGTSRELSRITSWIATANSSLDRLDDQRGDRRNAFAGNARGAGRRYRVIGHGEEPAEHQRGEDRDGYDHDNSRDAAARRRRRRIARTMRRRDAAASAARRSGSGSAGDSGNGSGTSRSSGSGRGGNSGRGSSAGRRSSSGRGRISGRGGGSGRGSGSGRGRSMRSRSSSGGRGESGRSQRSGSRGARNGRSRARSRDRDVVRYDRERRSREYETRARAERETSQREPRETRQRRSERTEHESDQTTHELRFYLESESPVVDAPEIGARMAERLHAIGIHTVDDLLGADAESAASELDHRRVDADRFLRWQQQAAFVCRVPMLRGHDAQLLVAADVTTPEELAESDAEELFSVVDPVARSSEGKRIVRGGKLPDLDEVTDWIRFAQHTRELQAA